MTKEEAHRQLDEFEEESKRIKQQLSRLTCFVSWLHERGGECEILTRCYAEGTITGNVEIGEIPGDEIRITQEKNGETVYESSYLDENLSEYLVCVITQKPKA